MTSQDTYEHGVCLRDRIGALRTALSADEWDLDETLRKYRMAPTDDARKLIAVAISVRMNFLSAEIFGSEKGRLI